jgi:hypothetical protein
MRISADPEESRTEISHSRSRCSAVFGDRGIQCIGTRSIFPVRLSHRKELNQLNTTTLGHKGNLCQSQFEVPRWLRARWSSRAMGVRALPQAIRP